MAKGVVVITEQRDGEFRKVAYEAVSEGRRVADALNSSLTAVVMGSSVVNIAKELGEYGADKVLVADDSSLTEYTTDTYTHVLSGILSTQEPDVIIMGASNQGKDLTGRLSARLDAGLAVECVSIKVEDDKIKCVRPMFGGKVLAEVEIEGTPKLVTIRPNVMSIVETSNNCTVEQVTLEKADVKIHVVDRKIETGEKMELTEADIIVAGGHGTGGDYDVIEALAGELNAAVGASRSAVDEGWRSHSDQVGQTGKVVSPNLYVACGISGAIQHLAGISTSKYIAAINNDPETPIFLKADFGIVGDLFDVVPELIKEVKKVKG